MRSPENIPSFETSPEIMELPEVEVKEERGPLLLSLLLKGYDSEWREAGPNRRCSKNEIEEKTYKFFKKEPLDNGSKKFLEGIGALEEGGVDDETLYKIALTYGRPERVDHIFDLIEKHKKHIKEPLKIRDGLVEELEKMESSLPEDLKKALEEETLKDIELRKENIKTTKERFNDILEFFKPHAKTTNVERVSIMPTDPLQPEDSFSSFRFGNETVLHSHIENPKGLEHEFLHPIINPIVKKLENKLTEEQKKNVVEMGSHNLRVEQGYGDYHFVLLSEELIRTYNDLLQKVETPVMYEDFQKKLKDIDETDFKDLMKEQNFIDRCKELNILTLDDLKRKSSEYYERFEKNELREVIFLFYQKYIHNKEESEESTFERFFLENFDKEI